MDSNLTSVIGRGLIFPITLTNGRPDTGQGSVLIHSSLRTILCWPKGSRFFLPTFGSRLSELIEEPNDEVLEALIRRFIIDSIAQWENRIELTRIELTRNPLTPGTITVSLTYKILETNQVDTFVYPFNTTF